MGRDRREGRMREIQTNKDLEQGWASHVSTFAYPFTGEGGGGVERERD